MQRSYFFSEIIKNYISQNLTFSFSISTDKIQYSTSTIFPPRRQYIEGSAIEKCFCTVRIVEILCFSPEYLYVCPWAVTFYFPTFIFNSSTSSDPDPYLWTVDSDRIREAQKHVDPNPEHRRDNDKHSRVMALRLKSLKRVNKKRTDSRNGMWRNKRSFLPPRSKYVYIALCTCNEHSPEDSFIPDWSMYGTVHLNVNQCSLCMHCDCVARKKN